MRLGLGLGVDSITSQKVGGAGFTGILDEYSGAAAAYSVRRLSSTYTDSAINVRRSSDGTSQNIGFDANGDLDTTALLAFVNAERTIADDDFSSSTGWTLAAGVSISGGVLSCLNSSASSTAYKNFGASDGVGTKIRVSFTISNYSGSGTISFKKFGTPTFTETSSDQGTARSGNGTYTEELTFSTVTTNANWGFFTNGNFTGDIDNFEVVQITADGAVTTFYDQSGNGNNATNTTASEQPKIVSGGTTITKNGKPCLDFDGNNNGYELSDQTLITSLTDGTHTAISVHSVDDVTGSVDNMIYSVSDRNGVYNLFALSYRSNEARAGYYNGSSWSANDIAASNNTQYLGFNVVVSGVPDFYQNTSQAVSGSNPTVDGNQGLSIGKGTNNNWDLFGTIQELIFFASDQSTNRTGIETNINDHFNIYTP